MISNIRCIILVTGVITHTNYSRDEEISWEIESDCESVHIFSNIFKTEKDIDIVRINDKTYSGEISINEVIRSNFSVSFDPQMYRTEFGFMLEWRCAQCCFNLNVTGASNNTNQLYFQNGTLVNNHPFYIGLNKSYAIWFDKVNDWTVGHVFFWTSRF